MRSALPPITEHPPDVPQELDPETRVLLRVVRVARRLLRASSPVSASSISDREQDLPEIGLPGAGSSSLSYDSSLDQYVYVWKTNENWAGTCRRLVVRLIDGTDHVAEFRFK